MGQTGQRWSWMADAGLHRPQWPMVAVLASLSSFKCKVYMSSFFCIRPGAGRSRARKRGQGHVNDAVGLATTAVEAVRVSYCLLSLAPLIPISDVHPGTENFLMAESINVAMHSMGSRCLSPIGACSIPYVGISAHFIFLPIGPAAAPCRRILRSDSM